jgi:hypothetical protein
VNFFRNLSSFPALAILLSFLFSPSARADTTIGDSALVVAFSTLGGAVLGASTLPFYEEPGDHTKNIFYGAALGAVIGVFISAYTGVKGGRDFDEEDARLKNKRGTSLSLNDAPELRLRTETTSAMRKGPSFAGGAPMFWSSVAKVSF